MIEATPNRQNETTDRFWNFLASLQKYIDVVKGRSLPDDDPARTLLLSTLTAYMRPVLRADLTCVGYQSTDNTLSNWLQVVEATIKPEGGVYQQSPLIQRIKDADWRFPYDQFSIIRPDNPITLFDQGLQKLPVVFQGVVTALAVSQVTLFGRKYFIFFFDIEEKVVTFPRYTEFDKAMLKVATGILEIGFQSGTRMVRKELQRNQVFISYSHKDRVWLEKLQTHLKPLQVSGKVSVWSDTQIEAGTNWRKEIQKALNSAKVAVLLVSPNFLASDFIAKNELPKLLKMAKEEGLVIYCIAISASSFKETRIGKYQFANDPGRPLNTMTNAKQDAELVKICEHIKSAISS